MKPFGIGLLTLVIIGTAQAHNIWIIPSPKGDSAEVVWSDDPAPDNVDEPLTTIAGARVVMRGVDGGEENLKWHEDKNVYRVTCPGKGARTLAVNWKDARGPASTLVVFCATTNLPNPTEKEGQAKKGTAWDRLELQIVPRPDVGAHSFQVLFKGRPLANHRVRAYSTVEPLTGEKRSPTTNKDGLFTFVATMPGVYGFRIQQRTNNPVEHAGVKCANCWYETTFVFRVPGEARK
jgi:hypothetical protein